MKQEIIAIALFLCAVLLPAGCSQKEKATPRPPVGVKVMAVGQGLQAGDEAYVGTVVESSGMAVSFQVPGSISRLYVDEGAKVARGQLLATLDPATLRQAHASQAAVLRQAADAYRRYKRLHEQGTISEIQWMEVQSKYEQAKAAEAMAREQLSHTSVRAPKAGVISDRMVEEGSNVAPGQPIMKLVDVSRVDIRISVPENRVSAVKVGTRAEIKVSALGGATYAGSVTEKGVEANPISHTYEVKMNIANPGSRLMPGMVCDVRLYTGKAVADGGEITVPSQAVGLDTDGERFVWVSERGIARRRTISVGGFVPGGVSVTSGLRAGEKVIVEGCSKVSEGMKVKEI